MTDILTKLRAATGPDRGLDARIFAGNRWKQHLIEGDSDFHVADYVPPYTASIDAALSLRPKLPNGAYLCTILEIYASGQANCCLHPFKGPPIWSRKQATAPLAILIAIFEALEAQHE